MNEVQVTEEQGLPTREQIVRLQNAMIPHAHQLLEPRHMFAPGVYLRRLLVRAGEVVVGKTHKHAHFLMVMSGKAWVVSEFGRELLEGGYVGISQPGVKRVVVGIEDTEFITIHHNPDNGEDLEAIEAAHIEPEVLGVEYETKGALQ